MKKIVFILLFITGYAFAGELPITTFKGGVDVVAQDKQNEEYAPFDSILNIRTDEKAQLTTALGTQKDNATSLGSYPVRSGYVYKQADGDEYKIIEIST